MDLDRTRLLPNDLTNPNGHRPLFATLGTLASFVVVLLMATSSAGAATLNVSGGQLLGAFDVNVGGNLFDVEFLDGTCIALYSGCDEVTDFTFQSSAAAALAGQALLDQVFLDVAAGAFDTEPILTNGCGNTALCSALTPFGFVVAQPEFAFALGAVNFDPNGVDVVGGVLAINISADLTQQSNPTFAVWSPVPEPGTALLMGLGLLGLSVRNRRQG